MNPFTDQFTDEFTELHPDRLALMTVDTQNDFALPGALYAIPGAPQIVPREAELVRAARAAGRSIFHIIRIYLRDGSNADLRRKAELRSGKLSCIPSSDGVELVDALKPAGAPRLDADLLLRGELQSYGPNEWVCYKPRWGAFSGTRMAEYLRARGLDSVLICGISFSRCVLSSVIGASEQDFRVGLVTDATTEVYETELGYMRGMGVQVMDVARAKPLLSSVRK